VTSSLWGDCTVLLQQELSAQQYNTWIRPLIAEHDGHDFCLIAPNRFVMDWVNQKFIHRIHELVNHVCSQSEQPIPELIAVKVAGRQKPAFQSSVTSRSSATGTAQPHNAQQEHYSQQQAPPPQSNSYHQSRAART